MDWVRPDRREHACCLETILVTLEPDDHVSNCYLSLLAKPKVLVCHQSTDLTGMLAL